MPTPITPAPAVTSPIVRHGTPLDDDDDDDADDAGAGVSLVVVVASGGTGGGAADGPGATSSSLASPSAMVRSNRCSWRPGARTTIACAPGWVGSAVSSDAAWRSTPSRATMVPLGAL